MRGFVRGWLDGEARGDEQVADLLRDEKPDVDEALSTILSTAICRALARFDSALETGAPGPTGSVRALLATAVSLAGNAEDVPLRWISNLCRRLIDDLWKHSLRQNLPTEPPDVTEEKLPDLRLMFISPFDTRKISEIELWRSQRQAV